jgi:UDP-N-acetylglucosamine acyltransferase
VSVHPTAVVTDGVELGVDVAVGPHAVLLGPCRVGDGVQIGPGCVIGTPPELVTARQNLAWNADPAHHGVEIGAGTVVREMCSIQQGAFAPTSIGAGCWLLTRTYVAHDCVLGDGVTTSAGVALGGHVQVGPGANLGMNAVVHQRRVVGPSAMVGMSAVVTRDVPPFALAYGNPARVRGANAVAMRRRGVAVEEIEALDAGYRSAGDLDPDRFAGSQLAGAWEWWTERTPGAVPLRPR